MRIGLLSNPGSTRNRVGMAAIEALAERTPEILHRRFEPALGFGPPLQSFAAAGCDLVVVSGGDGTVQGILTELLATARSPSRQRSPSCRAAWPT